MLLKNGRYITKAGSTLKVSGEYSGKFQICFDWVEEGGCIECRIIPEPEISGCNENLIYSLIWDCDDCGHNSAVLYRDGECQ